MASELRARRLPTAPNLLILADRPEVDDDHCRVVVDQPSLPTHRKLRQLLPVDAEARSSHGKSRFHDRSRCVLTSSHRALRKVDSILVGQVVPYAVGREDEKVSRGAVVERTSSYLRDSFNVWRLVRIRNHAPRKIVEVRILEIGVAEAVGRLEAAFDVTRVEATATDNINFTRMVPPETILLGWIHSIQVRRHSLRPVTSAKPFLSQHSSAIPRIGDVQNALVHHSKENTSADRREAFSSGRTVSYIVGIFQPFNFQLFRPAFLHLTKSFADR
mmetsp:Transcript_51423/g.160467  ORF Transcript_51423/g.160467 Transcript_51423/m.160467 type:complete len:274 (-) Transcript_51423:780-1601(-)